jgi:hypothetical protein
LKAQRRFEIALPMVTRFETNVLVQREMDRWGAPLTSVALISPGPVCTAEKRWQGGGRAAPETATGFKKKDQVGLAAVHTDQRATQTETG